MEMEGELGYNEGSRKRRIVRDGRTLEPENLLPRKALSIGPDPVRVVDGRLSCLSLDLETVELGRETIEHDVTIGDVGLERVDLIPETQQRRWSVSIVKERARKGRVKENERNSLLLFDIRTSVRELLLIASEHLGDLRLLLLELKSESLVSCSQSRERSLLLEGSCELLDLALVLRRIEGVQD
jgi:hypothetical protein